MQGSMDLKSKSLPKFLCIQFIYINFAILKKHYSRSIMSVWNKMISIYFNIMNKVSTVFFRNARGQAEMGIRRDMSRLKH